MRVRRSCSSQHEFGGNHASWEPQLRYFSRRHRCITYAARGYPPSDVPDRRRGLFAGHRRGRCRLRCSTALKIDKAHIVGLSMGGFCDGAFRARASRSVRCRSSSRAPAMAAEEFEDYFRCVSLEVADQFRSARRRSEFSQTYALGGERAARSRNKDPRGWQRIRADRLATHSDRGLPR